MFLDQLRIVNGKVYTIARDDDDTFTEDADGNFIYTESTNHTIL